MGVEYTGEDKEGKELAKKLNKAMSRPHKVSPSWDEEDWIECKECGEKNMTVFADTGLCFSCDEKENNR